MKGLTHRFPDRSDPVPMPAIARHSVLPVLAAATLLVATEPVRAAEPKHLGTFRDWNAFILEEPSGKVCWMASRPKKQQGDFTKRGDVFVLVTHRPAENSRDVVSFVAGYSFAEGTEATVQIGNRKFELFTDNDTAWTRDDKTDRALSQAIREGASMTVRGTSSRGTRTTDTYSLSGSGAAYRAIGDACGVTG